MVAEPPRRPLLLNSQRDTHAYLNPEHVMCRSGQLRIPPHVAVEIEVVDALEVLHEVLPHPVERELVYKAVVRHKAHDPIPIPSRSVAQRKNFTYMSDNEFLLVALESLA